MFISIDAIDMVAIDPGQIRYQQDNRKGKEVVYQADWQVRKTRNQKKKNKVKQNQNKNQNKKQ